MSLAGRHALVTGAGRGIGRACALALADAGASVTLAARSRDELEAVAAEIADRGGSAFAHPVDVRDEAAVDAAVAAAYERGVDIVVNCAGLNRPGPTTELALEDWSWSWT